MHPSLIDLGLTAEHEANLRKLAEGLLERAFPGTFHMASFRAGTDAAGNPIAWACQSATDPGCGTAGCALGWAPVIVSPMEKSEDFVDYGERVLGLTPYEESDEAWEWCFGGDWQYSDNSPEGAAKRILYMLEHGVPEDSFEQMAGDTALCY